MRFPAAHWILGIAISTITVKCSFAFFESGFLQRDVYRISPRSRSLASVTDETPVNAEASDVGKAIDSLAGAPIEEAGPSEQSITPAGTDRSKYSVKQFFGDSIGAPGLKPFSVGKAKGAEKVATAKKPSSLFNPFQSSFNFFDILNPTKSGSLSSTDSFEGRIDSLTEQEGMEKPKTAFKPFAAKKTATSDGTSNKPFAAGENRFAAKKPGTADGTSNTPFAAGENPFAATNSDTADATSNKPFAASEKKNEASKPTSKEKPYISRKPALESNSRVTPKITMFSDVVAKELGRAEMSLISTTPDKISRSKVQRAGGSPEVKSPPAMTGESSRTVNIKTFSEVMARDVSKPVSKKKTRKLDNTDIAKSQGVKVESNDPFTVIGPMAIKLRQELTSQEGKAKGQQRDPGMIESSLANANDNLTAYENKEANSGKPFVKAKNFEEATSTSLEATSSPQTRPSDINGSINAPNQVTELKKKEARMRADIAARLRAERLEKQGKKQDPQAQAKAQFEAWEDSKRRAEEKAKRRMAMESKLKAEERARRLAELEAKRSVGPLEQEKIEAEAKRNAEIRLNAWKKAKELGEKQLKEKHKAEEEKLEVENQKIISHATAKRKAQNEAKARQEAWRRRTEPELSQEEKEDDNMKSRLAAWKEAKEAAEIESGKQSRTAPQELSRSETKKGASDGRPSPYRSSSQTKDETSPDVPPIDPNRKSQQVPSDQIFPTQMLDVSDAEPQSLSVFEKFDGVASKSRDGSSFVDKLFNLLGKKSKPMIRPFFVEKPEGLFFLDIGEELEILESIEKKAGWRPWAIINQWVEEQQQKPPAASVSGQADELGRASQDFSTEAWSELRRFYRKEPSRKENANKSGRSKNSQPYEGTNAVDTLRQEQSDMDKGGRSF